MSTTPQITDVHRALVKAIIRDLSIEDGAKLLAEHDARKSVQVSQDGASLIARERRRGVEVEGYTAAHDAEHRHGQLAAAAITYADVALVRITYLPEAQEREITEIMANRWPFEEEWFKPAVDPVDNLVKAGALIAAEIDRINHAKGAS